MDLHADVGDVIVVERMPTGASRRGEILEVLGEADSRHYRVRWDDGGHETIFFPGTTARVVHPGGPGGQG